jgi:hypothetical protein
MTPDKFFLMVALVLITSQIPAHSADQRWTFTASEIEVAYRYQTQFGRRLSRPLKPAACFTGQTEFVATFQSKSFTAPCLFITETIRHLKQAIDLGAAKYFFPLDADHAHLVVPIEVWAKKYREIPADEILPLLLREPRLAAVYHTAEHLAIRDPGTGTIASEAKIWKEKRNAVGFYDGRALEILPPQPEDFGVSVPAGYREVTTFNLMAHRLGEVSFSAMGQAFTIDISFDDDLAVNLP